MTAPCIVALDTATEVCSMALLRGGVLDTASEQVGQRHSERALPMLDALLRRTHTLLGDVDVFAFGAGPGSFTGLRIACGLVQGLAWGVGKPVVAVGNLHALAQSVFAANAEVRTLLCAIDARMNEAYCAVYRRGDIPIEVRSPALARPEQLSALATDVDAIAGNALTAFPHAWPDRAGLSRFPAASANAGDIARMAASPAMLATAVAAHLAAPVYVRDTVASTTAERRARAASS
jgi:tRNA threonylcarbamoyladenosine biosynthesis protein TsaB